MGKSLEAVEMAAMFSGNSLITFYFFRVRLLILKLLAVRDMRSIREHDANCDRTVTRSSRQFLGSGQKR